MALDKFRRIDMQINRANDYQIETQFVKEGDYNGRELVVQITDAGEVSNQSGVSLNLGWKHNSAGNSGLDPFRVVDASKGIFKITYPTEMLITGDVTASIQVLESGRITLTRNFKITVENNPIDEGAIVSENSFTVLQEALVKVNDLEDNYAPRLNEVTAQLAQISINVKTFGAKGDGITDDTQSIQDAIDFCLTKTTSVSTTSQTYAEGYYSLYFPRGVYKVSSTLNVTKCNGFKIIGESQQATQIIFTDTNSTLFEWGNYLNNKIENITFTSGTIQTVDGNLRVVFSEDKTNTCFNYNSTVRGGSVSEVNVTYQFFKTVYNSISSNINGDNHHHIDCQYHQNTEIWLNSNSQALIWSFTNCKAYFNDFVFINPASSLTVRGGDFINPGDFLTVNKSGFGNDTYFNGLRFESFQNIDSSRTPRLLNLIEGSGNVYFEKCTQRGGGSLGNKITGNIRGLWNVELKDSLFEGVWNVEVTSALGGSTNKITFEKCYATPIINQTLNPNIGNTPLNLEYKQHKTGLTTEINRSFKGLVGSHINSLSHVPMIDMFNSQGILNNNTVSKTIPHFVVNPYQLQIKGISITWFNNSTNTATLTVWSNESKAEKIAEVTTDSLNGQYQIFQVPYEQLLNKHTINATDDPLFLEISSNLNVGTYKTNVYIEYIQVS